MSGHPSLSVPDLTTEGFGMHTISASDFGETTIESATFAKNAKAVSVIQAIATPNEAAGAAVELYGSSASIAAAHCALTARCDGRDNDYRFWLSVFKLLRPECAA